MKEKYNITTIYSSTFFRCTETARIVNELLNLEIILEPRFNEYKSMGEESWKQCQARNMDAISDIISKHGKDEAVICVSSGLNIAAFINFVYHLEPSENTPFIGVPSCSPIIFDI